MPCATRYRCPIFWVHKTSTRPEFPLRYIVKARTQYMTGAPGIYHQNYLVSRYLLNAQLVTGDVKESTRGWRFYLYRKLHLFSYFPKWLAAHVSFFFGKSLSGGQLDKASWAIFFRRLQSHSMTKQKRSCAYGIRCATKCLTFQPLCFKTRVNRCSLFISWVRNKHRGGTSFASFTAQSGATWKMFPQFQNCSFNYHIRTTPEARTSPGHVSSSCQCLNAGFDLGTGLNLHQELLNISSNKGANKYMQNTILRATGQPGDLSQ